MQKHGPQVLHTAKLTEYSPQRAGQAVHHDRLIVLGAMQQPSTLLASAVTKTMLYVALMMSLSPCTCVLSALEASAADGGLSASRISAGYVATPSEALEFKDLDVLRFLLNVCLQTRARAACDDVRFLVQNISCAQQKR